MLGAETGRAHAVEQCEHGVEVVADAVPVGQHGADDAVGAGVHGVAAGQHADEDLLGGVVHPGQFVDVGVHQFQVLCAQLADVAGGDVRTSPSWLSERSVIR